MIWLILNLLSLAWWPPFDFNGDEAWVADYLINHGKAKMMLGWSVSKTGLLLLDTPLYFGYAGLFLEINKSIWFLRLSSLLPGLLSLPLIYLIARDEGHRWEGLVAAVVLGLSGPFLWTFHYLRWESLTTFMGLMSVWLFIRGTRGQAFQMGLAGLIASVAVLSHPVGLTFPIGMFLSGFTARGWARKAWLWAGLFVGSVIFTSLNILPNIPGPLLSDAFTSLSSRPALLMLFAGPKAILPTILKIFYKPVMLVASGAEYGSHFISPILGVLSLCFLLVDSEPRKSLTKALWRKSPGCVADDASSHSPLRWLWAFILLSFGLLVMRQEHTNILFPLIVLCATLFLGKIKEHGTRAWFLLPLLIPEMYLLQGEFRRGRDHLLNRERMIETASALIPPGSRVVSSSPALLWGGIRGNYQVFRMADPDYLSGRISLREALAKHNIDYIVVDLMPGSPAKSYYNIGIAERALLSDTSLFEPLGTFPGGYMLSASAGKDNLVDSFAIYRVK
ncbi:MAG: glycosyltransferase family 39 protein [candidate division WOR-3 bacterium]